MSSAATSSCASAAPNIIRAPMSASAATIPCSRLPTAASPSATASSAESSSAWTCRRAKRNRDSRERAVPGGAAQGFRKEPQEGEVAGPLLFLFSLEKYFRGPEILGALGRLGGGR